MGYPISPHGPWKKNRIDNVPIREAVEKWQKENEEHTLRYLYDRIFPDSKLGYKARANELSRKLGKCNYSARKSINIDVAIKIIRAIGRDPWEFDI